MTPKEKAAESASKRHCWPQAKISDVYEYGFLAGCAYQEQVDREVIDGLINDISYIAKNPLLLNTTDLQEALIEIINAYHKATGKVEWSGG